VSMGKGSKTPHLFEPGIETGPAAKVRRDSTSGSDVGFVLPYPGKIR
jgi:hypothetical protein